MDCVDAVEVAHALETSNFLFCTTTSYTPYLEAELILDSSVNLAAIRDPSSTLQRTVPSNVTDGTHRCQPCNTPGPRGSKTSSLVAWLIPWGSWKFRLQDMGECSKLVRRSKFPCKTPLDTFPGNTPRGFDPTQFKT